MISVDFLNRIAKMRQESRNRRLAATASGLTTSSPIIKKTVGTRPGAYARSTPTDINVVVYDPNTGKAYPNPAAARTAGVMRFTFNMPPGMKIDWSYWDRFKQPEPEPVKTDDITPSDVTLPFEPTKVEPLEYPGGTGGVTPAGDDDDGPPGIDYTNTDPAYWKDIAANRADEVWIPNLEKTGLAQTVGKVAKAAGVRAVEGSNFASNDPSKTRKNIVVARRDRMGVLPGKPGYDPNTFESDR
tara:strand:- start:11235 stop:11963 length:729 start_codon:yes stop_codon:yes gene_type:complete